MQLITRSLSYINYLLSSFKSAVFKHNKNENEINMRLAFFFKFTNACLVDVFVLIAKFVY